MKRPTPQRRTNRLIAYAAVALILAIVLLLPATCAYRVLGQ